MCEECKCEGIERCENSRLSRKYCGAKRKAPNSSTDAQGRNEQVIAGRSCKDPMVEAQICNHFCGPVHVRPCCWGPLSVWRMQPENTSPTEEYVSNRRIRFQRMPKEQFNGDNIFDIGPNSDVWSATCQSSGRARSDWRHAVHT